jgi:putative membrane protein
MNICGGCERIKKTPIAGSYRTFIRQSIALYLITLPWGIVDLMHWWIIVVVPAVAYFMIGVEVIAEDIEEPFGRDDDDLPLDAICEVIDRSVREIVVG